MQYKVWGEITYPFPSLNGTTGEVWDRISNFTPDVVMYEAKFGNGLVI